jgi:hypothetical protein
MLFSLLTCLQFAEVIYIECTTISVTAPDGQPVSGVLVRYVNAGTGRITYTLTDQSGRAELDISHDKDSFVELTKSGYETRGVLASEIESEVKFKDFRTAGSVTGKVVSARGAPVRSGVVFAGGSQLGQSHVVRISEDGQFTFSALPAGVTVELHASVEGQSSEEVTVTVPEGSTKVVNLVMDEKRNIFGKIALPKGSEGWRKVVALNEESQLVSEHPFVGGLVGFSDLAPSIYKIGIRRGDDIQIVGEVGAREKSVYGLTFTVE